MEGGSDNGADFKVENLALLPRLLWQHYELAGEQAGPLVKYPPPPEPTTEIGIAAAAGDIAKLRAALEAGTSTSEEANTVLERRESGRRGVGSKPHGSGAGPAPRGTCHFISQP